MKLRLWPRSLATRTAVTVVAGLALVQIAGLLIHALDRMELQRLAQMRETAQRVMGVYRSMALAPSDERDSLIAELDRRSGMKVTLGTLPPADDMLPVTPQPLMRALRADMAVIPMPAAERPREFVIRGGPSFGAIHVAMRMADGHWVDVQAQLPPVRPWHSLTFLTAFLLMWLVAVLLTLWAVRRLTAPVRTLAAAAEELGRDVNARPLAEDGPAEIATAAIAFNTMAARIRRFVQDRTFLLTALGHDLRTPITRLKLRLEFLEEDELRRKLLADVDELERMVAATLAFGRDVTGDEPVTTVDLTELARTVLDETADAEPEMAEKLSFEGPQHLTARVRPASLKRALTNLVSNAVKYGGAARVRLAEATGTITFVVEDDGPGIPAGELERVFQPFQRLESSRNRETGGTGLGLPIARNILRAHGGDVVLARAPTGGTRAVATLPV
ncbi:MAG: HAMP domain-containing protein [Acidisphaera sp.]|nr:HAMP domain-containing protein [Acidisphaera sp.]MBV9813959.1 HAMP domain-containing protein [Acetobacteraceae bacterium]